MSKILHRLAMAALGTAAIFAINTLNNLTEASAAGKFDQQPRIHQNTLFSIPVPSHFHK
ncbi:MAG: hypothetical protein JGK17_27335 [Microcoleus sp. PH2017_10_PVI_O_A]|uniref:hypothetical protein n=1 Tax=unclassified Microcoleus TaxID=2642155 RepID=UPI001D8681E3|nr:MULTISPECIES: hypothetical protein [unclassified Microcoleus]MCC3409215.1 hypothetical protein [Microcoleus sp. PH2017_10_PVI_O_A]MCC3463453.1 hypothetical protein [Microcoleus sp. PH2017_11_PCY_U_A]MCC3481285.1 hypothetical protein [Microcoleus sp. PH2017_12_PCY_D_A]MCC3531312.1 hypothetical protein [Microcoleus sp. PH2017_21_RUC_O_A]MCC3543589.1 hypothetical protein [Microcoleus sp. PH2017_22_RUC_O_B]